MNFNPKLLPGVFVIDYQIVKKKNVFRATDWEYNVKIEKFKMAIILVKIRNFLQLLWNLVYGVFLRSLITNLMSEL